MEGGPYQEYFYIEIPVAAGSAGPAGDEGSSGAGGEVARDSKPRHRRFVYVQEEGARRFPMQFGLEVRLMRVQSAR
jgi:hypothetical protein